MANNFSYFFKISRKEWTPVPKEHALFNLLILFKMKKINLKEFKQDQLAVSKLLEAKGGSGDCNTSGSVNCQTRTCGGDADYKRCDGDF